MLIDGFSRYTWTRPLKTKTGKETADAIESVFETLQLPPTFFVTDKGKEFMNRDAEKVYDRYGIKFYTMTGRFKNGIVERFNRTLKEQLARYFTEMIRRKQPLDWSKVLEQFTYNYNHRYHSSIGMSPAQVDYSNMNSVRKLLYPNSGKKVACSFKVGDKVRIIRDKDLFKKGYDQSWSDKVYSIKSVHQNHGICYFTGKLSVLDLFQFFSNGF